MATTQTAVKKAIKAAQQAGLDIARVKVKPDGTIEIETKKLDESEQTEHNPFDDVK